MVAGGVSRWGEQYHVDLVSGRSDSCFNFHRRIADLFRSICRESTLGPSPIDMSSRQLWWNRKWRAAEAEPAQIITARSILLPEVHPIMPSSGQDE